MTKRRLPRRRQRKIRGGVRKLVTASAVAARAKSELKDRAVITIMINP